MSLKTTTHSENFISKWKEVMIELYGYENYMNFLIVPSLFNKKTLSYVPLLNYTDRLISNCEDLVELAKDNEYQIRVLNPEYTDFKDDDTVTMRLDISSNDSEFVFNNLIKSRCRNKIRKSISSNKFNFSYGNNKQAIDDFYNIFSRSMHKHGTPVFTKDFFYLLSNIYKKDCIYYNVYDEDIVIASMVVIVDRKLAVYLWGGINDNYNKSLVGYFIYWNAIKNIITSRNCDIFDFWRSGYNSGTYKFKSQWGAIPIKLDIIKSKQDENIYAKYFLASTIWKKLPKNVVDFIGPKLCKYLVDL